MQKQMHYTDFTNENANEKKTDYSAAQLAKSILKFETKVKHSFKSSFILHSLPKSLASQAVFI